MLKFLEFLGIEFGAIILFLGVLLLQFIEFLFRRRPGGRVFGLQILLELLHLLLFLLLHFFEGFTTLLAKAIVHLLASFLAFFRVGAIEIPGGFLQFFHLFLIQLLVFAFILLILLHHLFELSLGGLARARAEWMLHDGKVVEVRWRLADGATLQLVAWLGAEPVAARAIALVGDVLYATAPAAGLEQLPPWLVRCSLGAPRGTG